jgi:hypothetical protein
MTENLKIKVISLNVPFACVVNQGIFDDREPSTVQEITTNGSSTPPLACQTMHNNHVLSICSQELVYVGTDGKQSAERRRMVILPVVFYNL